MRFLYGSALTMLLTWTAGAPPVLAAQSEPAAAAKKAPPKDSTPKSMTLVGCVTGDGTPGRPFKLADAQDGTGYRLTGANVRAFAGKRVEVVGGPDSRRVKIVGGLVPSANVAGQAGAMDPARAAVESAPLSTAAKNEPELREFRVRSVRSVTGGCEQ
ncbi:MAG: hypothetical protein ABUS56_10910 [Acidobacteriota bacterium]